MEEIKDIIGNLIPDRRKPEGDDYYGEDGLLYCGKCRTKKESRIMVPDFRRDDGAKRETVVPVICKCKQDEMKAEEERRKHEEEMQRLNALRKSSLIEEKFRSATLANFQKTEDNQKLYAVAKKYIENFPQMEQENQGLLFYGVVGTGKSFTAACIANELLNNRTSVVMTSFVKILQEIQKPQTDESEFMAKLNSPRLLIIDDLGTERNTEYALEKVYNVIDSRYRVRKPLILTTNLSLQEMQDTPDIRYKRIYDRIFEMCYPVRAAGRSWREQEAARRFDNMKKLMEE